MVTRGSLDFVGLDFRFTSGWPWPEESWGLGPMYGEDGWCRACGVPKHGQTGSLVIQGAKFPTAPAWIPNWQYDAVCVREDVVRDALTEFRVDLLPVRKPRGTESGVVQLVARTTGRPWYEESHLRRVAEARHGCAGARCADCGVWRWMPVSESDAAPVRADGSWSMSDVVASPEIFGDGWKAFRHLLFRRGLAEALAAANPRVFSLFEVPVLLA